MNLEDFGEVIWFDENGKQVGMEKDIEKPIPSNNEWIERNGDFFPAKNTKVVKELPPGFYAIGQAQGGIYFASKRYINNDELIHLPNAKLDQIIDEIDKFWTKAELFDKYKLLHKRGILLHGRPGCGKTSTINILSEKVINNKGIIFHVTTINDLIALIDFVHDYFRDIQPDTPIVVVIEDIDHLIRENESVVLNFLSGPDEFNHCVVIATTNRFGDLNDLLLRPTRFDWIEELPLPTKEGVRIYLEAKHLPKETIDFWIDKVNNFSMAELKELFIAVHLLDNDLDLTIEKIKTQAKNVKVSTFVPKGSIGYK